MRSTRTANLIRHLERFSERLCKKNRKLSLNKISETISLESPEKYVDIEKKLC